MNKFIEFQNEHADLLIEVTRKSIAQSVDNKELAEAMIYSLTAGGKRIRPILFLALLKTYGIENLSRYYDIAGSIEMIHTYSLIHDDLPEMDNDDLRRGKPTNHKVFGVGPAVLAGDALLTMAFEQITSNKVITADQKVDLVDLLSKRSGPKGMISGQWLDITNENKTLTLEQLEKLHSQKTGDLLLASFEMALRLGNTSHHSYTELTSFAKKIGLAFQIKDDILDITSSEKELGKATQKDNVEGKNTYPDIIGLEKSKQYLKELQESARKNLDELAADTVLFNDFLEYFDLGE